MTWTCTNANLLIKESNVLGYIQTYTNIYKHTQTYINIHKHTKDQEYNNNLKLLPIDIFAHTKGECMKNCTISCHLFKKN